LLKPTIKEEGVTERERYLSKLAEGNFFGLWSFPNLYTDEGIKKSKIGKELCDLLVICQNKIIIFSDKDIKFNHEKVLEVAWKRWFKKSVVASARQLYGAESFLKNHSERIYLDKACENKFPISLSEYNYEIHLIAVTYNTKKTAEDFFGKGSSGSFMQRFIPEENNEFNQPFYIGDLDKDKTFVHVFDELSLDLLMKELSTISDFINYLAEKERAIRSNEVVMSAGEEEFLAHFFNGRSDKDRSGKMTHPTGNVAADGSIVLNEGLWNEYIHSSEYLIFKDFFKKSLFWDRLIENFSNHVLRGKVALGENLEFSSHERAIRHLVLEDRISRYLLSNAFLEKIREVPTDSRSSRLVFSPSRVDKLYVFLFIPCIDFSRYEEYRQTRINYAEAYSLVAKFLNPVAKDIVVIATEPINNSGRSEDVYSVEYTQNLTKQQRSDVKKLMKEENILSDVYKHRNNDTRHNESAMHKHNKVKYGRNEKCHCGSNLKYKNCCM
jgi:hypothetical protein